MLRTDVPTVDLYINADVVPGVVKSSWKRIKTELVVAQKTPTNTARAEIELLLRGALSRLKDKNYAEVDNCIKGALATLLSPVV